MLELYKPRFEVVLFVMIRFFDVSRTRYQNGVSGRLCRYVSLVSFAAMRDALRVGNNRAGGNV